MASSKKQPMEPPKVIGDLLSSLSKNPVASDSAEIETTVPAAEIKSEKTEVPAKKVELTDEQKKKVAVNLNIPAHIKNNWKSFFAEHGLTMTDGLIAAVDYLEKQVNKGNVQLGAISIHEIN